MGDRSISPLNRSVNLLEDNDFTSAFEEIDQRPVLGLGNLKK
jgi:hypothetical protein